MTELFAALTPILGHVAGVPIEETLPGVIAVGVLGARLATEWFRRRLRWRVARGNDPVSGDGAG